MVPHIQHETRLYYLQTSLHEIQEKDEIRKC